MTPAAYVEVLRVERARQLLEEASDPVELVAAQCGFGTPETMRRAFARRVGVLPRRVPSPLPPHAGTSLTQRPERNTDADRHTCCTTASPPSTSSARTRSSTRCPGNESVFVAEHAGPIRNESDTLSMVADAALDEVHEPGHRRGPRRLRQPSAARARAAPRLDPRACTRPRTWTTSVCTGSLLLAAAGLLDGAPATTHWLARDLLAELGAKPVPDRVVEHGKIVTAAGVSSGIDMALTLVREINGDEVAQAVQLGIEYDPQPPLDAGSPQKAPREVVELVTAAFEARESAGMTD